MKRLGYCCINLSLKGQGITINRGMVKKTWLTQGKARASELAEQNLLDLLKILEWNVANDIRVYRMSSDIFPWMSEYRFEDLPNFTRLRQLMEKVGNYVQEHSLRISFHPGQFDVLASPNAEVVRKTVYDLDQHARIMDFMLLPKDYSAPINIHVGGTYGDKESALTRFCENFQLLSPSTKARLVVENDDKASQFGVADLYQGVYMKIGCPITFDHLHHRLCTNGLTAEVAAKLASTTWHGHRPMQHFSSPKSLYEDSSVVNRSHADYVYDYIPSYGIDCDVEVEAKAKDLAVLKYLADTRAIAPFSPKLFEFEQHGNTNPN
jgi:UV DNA damage endonuclease